MISCFKSTQLIEKQHLFKLTFIEKIQLKLHTKMCKTCAAYQYKSNLIEKGISNYVQQSEPMFDTSKLAHEILKKIEDDSEDS